MTKRQGREGMKQFAIAGFVEQLDITSVDDTLLWKACELAIYYETRSGFPLDPRKVNSDNLELLAQGILRPGESLSDFHAHKYTAYYWLLSRNARIGIYALTIFPNHIGSNYIHVASLYIFREYRGQGLGSKLLNRTYGWAIRNGFDGIRLSTEWVFQRLCHYYLKLGFWLHNWKRSLDFIWDRELSYFSYNGDSHSACLKIRRKNTWNNLYLAVREGEYIRIVFNPDKLADLKERESKEGLTTLSLILALNGLPLHQNAEEAHGTNIGDAGRPACFARRLQIFEAWEQKHGMNVSTPKIPGLAYPPWDVLQKVE
jgi:GNAT superfamily N-acetyltransferase